MTRTDTGVQEAHVAQVWQLSSVCLALPCQTASQNPDPQVLCCCAARSSSAWETEKPMRRQRPWEQGEIGRGMVLDRLTANRLQAN